MKNYFNAQTLVGLCFIFIFQIFYTNTFACGDDEATAFDYPLEDWYKTLGFDDSWSDGYGNYYEHHMAIDIFPNGEDAVGAEVISPCSGVVKFAQYVSTYGGMVILECSTGSECVSPFMAHLYSSSLQVSSGDHVELGQTIGYIADSSNNGGWTPHLHFGIRKGGYDNSYYTGCYSSSIWYYAGYPHECYDQMVDDMYDPEEFIPDHAGTCTTTEYRSVMVEAKASTYYNLYAWYQTQATSSLTSYGSVRDLSTESGFSHKASNFKQWYRARIAGSDNYRDIITSVEDGTKRKVYVFKATGDGGFDAPALWYTNEESKIDQLFVGDIDNDGDADLIFGDKNDSTKKFSWTRCTNNGSSFTSCTAWNNNSEDDKTFGKEDDVLLVADLNGNGKVELLRGREQTSGDCTGQLKWNRLGQEGVGSTIDDCWGYPEEIGSGDTYKAQYLAGDIDHDGADEIINIRINTSSGVVNAFKGNYNESTDSLTTSDWTADGVNIEGSNGWYYTADVNNDGYTDLVRWGDEGEVKWMKSENGVLKNTKYSLVTGLGRSEDNILLFGYFGDFPKTDCTKTTTSSGAAGGDDDGSFGTASIEDSDEDGLTDEEEISFGTDPEVKDTDGDGISDYEEYQTMLATLEAEENSGGGGGCSFHIQE